MISVNDTYRLNQSIENNLRLQTTHGFNKEAKQLSYLQSYTAPRQASSKSQTSAHGSRPRSSSRGSNGNLRLYDSKL